MILSTVIGVKSQAMASSLATLIPVREDTRCELE